jgi:hypothetical protein
MCGGNAQHGAGGDHQGGQSQRLILHVVFLLVHRREAVTGDLRKLFRAATAFAMVIASWVQL